jgi:hypothetical protein
MVIMKSGRMMLLRSGDLIIMDENMTMADGTKVMTDGTIVLMDGTTLTLVDGEGMIMDAPLATINQSER